MLFEIKAKLAEVKDVTSGREWTFEKYPGFIGELVKAGGLVNLVKEGKF